MGSFLAVDQIFRSSEKSKKIRSTDYESFDQLKKDNFDQVNFSQTTPCPFFELLVNMLPFDKRDFIFILQNIKLILALPRLAGCEFAATRMLDTFLPKNLNLR